MHSLLLRAFALCWGLVVAIATHIPLSDSGISSVPLLHLSSVGEGDFTTSSHSRFPNHRVRVKQSSFCNSTLKWAHFVYASFPGLNYGQRMHRLSRGAKHLFFYFFESRQDPAKDDVIMWTNGGPGCSSAMGLLMELGPCSINMKNALSNGTIWNPFSWNSEANIFFLDQPQVYPCPLACFSYADFSKTIETTEDAAKNVYAFISLFFESFPQFAGRALRLSGESYGGRYLAVFASEICDGEIYRPAKNDGDKEK
ncbi:serine carboxypeptidase-domain-containing protein [Mycena galopus ATCC 62051]|nr:serine carboxypeptidase-domain-containing protein [Mycena galopus ATCC 62051]